MKEAKAERAQKKSLINYYIFIPLIIDEYLILLG